MTHFAIVAPNYHPRTCGVGDYSMRLGQELQKRGHRVVVLSRSPVEPHPEAPGVRVVGFPAPTPLACAIPMLAFVAKESVTHVLLQYTPQMLGAWRFGTFAIPFLATALRRRGVRLTVVAHELFFDWALRPDIALGAVLQRIQMLLLLRAADDFVLTAEARRPLLSGLARLARRSAEVRVVPVGSSALPTPATISSQPFRIGVFSSLAVGKRFDVVLEAFRLIAQQVPDAELVLAGDLGSGKRRRTLERTVAAHPATSRIHVCGKLPLREIAEIVARLSVFLFPMNTGATTRSSTLPLALGSGVPVVAICGRETDALFRPDHNVVFADDLSGEAFARAVARLRATPGLAAGVGAGGLRLYQESLDWPIIASQLTEPRAT